MWNNNIKFKLLDQLEKSAIEASDQKQGILALSYSKAREMVNGVSADNLPMDFIANLETLVSKEFLQANIAELYDSKSEDGLTRLRRFQQARPQIAGELASWELQLRGLANSVQQEHGTSAEAEAALNLALIARKLNIHYGTIKKNNDNLQKAIASLQLGEINTIITSAKSVQRQLEEDKDFAEFAIILSDLLVTAKNFMDEANKAKDKVSGELSVNVTLKQSGEYDLALDDLYNKHNNGILQVLTAQGTPINTMEAIGQTRRDSIGFLNKKIKERITKANADLDKHSDTGLWDAKTELEEAQKLSNNRHVSEDLKREDIVSKDLRTLEEKIAGLFAARAEAVNLLKTAHGLDEIAALEQLNALRYKWLEDVAILKKQIQDKLFIKKNSLVDKQIRQSLLLCEERKPNEIENYRAALALLEQARSEIAEIQADVIDVIALLEKLDNQIKDVKTERNAWLEFCIFRKKFDELSLANQVEQGLLDQLSPQDRSYWQEHFKSEYVAIESKVIKQADTKIIFDKAWDCYLRDPADEQIKALLVDEKTGQKTISLIKATALQCRQADTLLNMYYAQVAWRDAKESLQNTDELINKYRDWHNNVQKRIQISKNFSKMMSDADADVQSIEEVHLKQDAGNLTRDLDQLLSKAEKIYNIWDRCNNLLTNKMYKDACLVIAQSKGEDDASPEVRNIYIVMQSHIKNTWRNERIKNILSVVANDIPSLDRLRKIAQETVSMEEFNVLNHDGDGLLISKVYSIWNLCEVEEALDFKLDQIQDDNLDDSLNKLASVRGLNWDKLLQHLDGLLKYPPEGKILRHASRLRLVALGYYGLTLDRKKSIDRLDEEIKGLSAMSDVSIVYVTLALRYLEEPSGFNQATKLAAELEVMSTRSYQIAFGLKKIIAAHGHRRNEDFVEAIDSLNIGVDTLRQFIPELSGAFERAIQQTTQGWYQSMGESILNSLVGETRLLQRSRQCPPREKFFKIWEKLNQAYRYLPEDSRVKNIIQLLNRFSKEIGIHILEDVNNLLDNAEDTLKHKIELGGIVLNYLDIAFSNEDVRTSYRPASDEWIELEGLRTDLRADYDQWQKAWKVLIESRQALKALLLLSVQQSEFDPDAPQTPSGSVPVEWVWNKDSKNKPLQVFDATQNSLNKTLDELQGYTPVEFNHINQFIGQFRQAATTILVSFQEFVQAVKNERYENAKNLLVEKLRVNRDGFEAKLNGLRSDVFDEPLIINLDPFYRLEDPMRGDYVIGLDNIEKHLDILQKNCTAWSELTHTIIAKVKDLTNKRNEARRYLTGKNGKLSDAANFCRDAASIPNILVLNEKSNDIPSMMLDLKRSIEEEIPNMQAPLSMRALREAKPDEDRQVAPASKPVRVAWEELNDASSESLKELWIRYLCFEVAAGLVDLGPKINNLDNLKDASPALNELWFEALRNPIKSLEKPNQASLEDLISERLKGLEESIQQINQHLGRFSGDKLTERSQAILRLLIEQADMIDNKAPRVLFAHQKYEQGQKYLAAKRK